MEVAECARHNKHPLTTSKSGPTAFFLFVKPSMQHSGPPVPLSSYHPKSQYVVCEPTNAAAQVRICKNPYILYIRNKGGSSPLFSSEKTMQELFIYDAGMAWLMDSIMLGLLFVFRAFAFYADKIFSTLFNCTGIVLQLGIPFYGDRFSI